MHSTRPNHGNTHRRPLSVLVAGTRTFNDYELFRREMAGIHDIATIIHGDGPGADQLAKRFAAALGIATRVFPAQWTTYLRSAGPIRNRQMAQHADCLIAFWDGVSPGTRHMITTMQRQQKPVTIIAVRT